MSIIDVSVYLHPNVLITFNILDEGFDGFQAQAAILLCFKLCHGGNFYPLYFQLTI